MKPGMLDADQVLSGWRRCWNLEHVPRQSVSRPRYLLADDVGAQLADLEPRSATVVGLDVTVGGLGHVHCEGTGVADAIGDEAELENVSCRTRSDESFELTSDPALIVATLVFAPVESAPVLHRMSGDITLDTG